MDVEVDNVVGEVLGGAEQRQSDGLVIAAHRGRSSGPALASVVSLDGAAGGATVPINVVSVVAGQGVDSAISTYFLADSAGVRSVAHLTVAGVAGGEAYIELPWIARTGGTD